MCNKKEPAYDMETLIREYGNDVLRCAYLYVRDYHLAEDVFQDVFIKVSRKIGEFHGESAVKTWIIRITINTCKDYLKSAYARRVVPMMEYKEEAISDASSYDQIEKKETNRILRDVVMELPDKFRELVICVYYQEMTISEAACILKIAEGTAKSRLKRARDKMKKMLEGRMEQ